MTRKALVRAPSPRLAEGLITHIERAPIDLDLATRQWHGYVDAVAEAGWEPVEVEPADDCPDSVFVEDTVVMLGGLAVISRPGALERRPETAGTEAVLDQLGYPVQRIVAPGTLDGGDVLKHGDTAWVGIGGRTNEAGAAQLAAFAAPRGIRVVAVPVTRVLHLKSGVTALPDGAVIGYPPLVDDPDRWPAFVPVPEPEGAHVVVLDDDSVLMAAGAPRSAALLRERGLRCRTVDISEFEKLEGCVTCLSVRLRAAPAR